MELPQRARCLLRCSREEHCPGDGTCRDGHTGGTCGECLPGYFTVESNCFVCPAWMGPGFVIALWLVFFLVAAASLLYRSRLNRYKVRALLLA